MNNEQNNLNSADQMETLVSRAVDGRATRGEWDKIEQAAAMDGGLWRRVALSYRDQGHMDLVLGEAADVADCVELPSRLEAERAAHASRGLGSVRAWGGWAAAAILTFGVVIQTNRLGQANSANVSGLQQGTNKPQSAGFLGTAAEAFDAYLNKGKEEGKVVGEVPESVLVDSQPAPDGQGYDVLIVRQVVERMRVPDLYRFSRDEAGTPRPVRVRIKSATAPSTY